MLLPKWQLVIATVLMTGMLSGCANSGKTARIVPIPVEAPLPPLPADVAHCFNKLTPAPKSGQPLTKQETLRLITRLRGNELNQSLCGKRLIAFYNQLKINKQNTINKNKGK